MFYRPETQVQVKPSLLRPIKHRGQEARIDLKLIHARCALVRSRTNLVNHVRGTVKSLGHRMPDCDAQVLHKMADSLPEEVKYILEPVLKQVGELTALIRGYDKAIETKAKDEPATAVLQQVKGVGALTALAFVLTVEDPNRFPQSRKIGSFLGLRPRLDESCTIKKQLRITKAGDKYLRSLLVGSAQYILGPFGPDTDLRRWGLKLAERGGKNAKKRAVVAVARKLSVLLLTMWKTGATYEPLRQAKRQATEVPTAGVVNPTPIHAAAKKKAASAEGATKAARRRPQARKLTKTASTPKPVKSPSVTMAVTTRRTARHPRMSTAGASSSTTPQAGRPSGGRRRK